MIVANIDPKIKPIKVHRFLFIINDLHDKNRFSLSVNLSLFFKTFYQEEFMKDEFDNMIQELRELNDEQNKDRIIYIYFGEDDKFNKLGDYYLNIFDTKICRDTPKPYIENITINQDILKIIKKYDKDKKLNQFNN